MNEQGFVDALIAMQLAPPFKGLKHIKNHLEEIMLHNIDAFDADTYGQIVVAYNKSDKKPLHGINIEQTAHFILQ